MTNLQRPVNATLPRWLDSYPHLAACPTCRDRLAAGCQEPDDITGAPVTRPWDASSAVVDALGAAAALAFHASAHRFEVRRLGCDHFG